MDKQSELLLIMLLEKQEEVIQLRRMVSELQESQAAQNQNTDTKDQ